MGDYTFVNEGREYTSTASASITGSQCLSVSGNNTVAPSGAGSGAFVGVAAHDALNGGRVTVLAGPGRIHRTASTGTVVAGDLLVTGAAGVVATAAAVTTPTAGDVTTSRAIIGVALEGATGGAVVRWKQR